MRLCPEGNGLWAAVLRAIQSNTPDLEEKRTAYLAHVTQAADVAIVREGESDAA
jgi:hypothetical protein